MTYQKYYEVTALHRDDLIDDLGQEAVDKLTDEQMQGIASQIGECINNEWQTSQDYALRKLGYIKD